MKPYQGLDITNPESLRNTFEILNTENTGAQSQTRFFVAQQQEKKMNNFHLRIRYLNPDAPYTHGLHVCTSAG